MRPKIIIVDEEDKIIGSKERGTLENKDIYRSSALWITNSQGHILLARRSLSKSHDPGKWGPAVAGTLEEGETHESNIIKEAEEELGLTHITPEKGLKIRVHSKYNYFCQWYTLTLDKELDAFTLQEEEVAEIKWFSREELTKELDAHPEMFLQGMLRSLKEGIN